MKKQLMILALTGVVSAGAVSLPVLGSVSVNAAQLPAVTVQTAASVSAAKVPINGTITAYAAKAESGSTYAFYYRLSGRDNWICSKAYSEELTAEIKVSAAGIYEVLVKTKSPEGKIKKEYLSFEAVDDLSVNGSLSAEKAPLGTGVTAYARAAGGNGGYRYSVYRRKSGDSAWKTVIKDSTSCNVLIDPASAGIYEVCIKVKDKTGVIRKEYYSFEAVDFSVDVSLRYDKISLGTTQTITASVSEGAADCSFSFYFKNPTDKDWRLIKNEAGSSSVTLKPSKTGTYSICAKAVNSSGKIRKAYTGFNVSKGLTVSHTLSAATIRSGSSLTVVPSSEGGNGKVQYAVYYTSKEQYESGANKWTTALKFGQSGNAVITPESVGEYVVVTKAKDETGVIKKTGYTYFSVENSLLAKGRFLNNKSTVNYRSGTTFIAEAEGGAGEYTYSVKFREKGTSQWKLLRDFGTDPDFTLDRTKIGGTDSNTKKNYELAVTVKDKDGATDEAVYAFTVNYSDKYELPIV